MPKPSSAPTERATWLPEMERTVIDGLLREVRLGKRAENGFKKDSYLRVLSDVNEKYDRRMDLQQLKNKYALVSNLNWVFDRNELGTNNQPV